jgi:DNA polymerase II small subunit
LTAESLRKAVKTLFEAGYQLEAEAFASLQNLSETLNPEELARCLLEILRSRQVETPFIGASLVEEAAEKLREKTAGEALKAEPTGKPCFKPLAREYEAEVKVLMDPTGRLKSKGEVGSFLEYFRDRFEKLRKLLMQRLDCRDASTLAEALTVSQGSKTKFVCMVSGKVSRGARVFLKVEDLEASATVLVQPSARNPRIAEKASSILLDQVICVSAVKFREDLFFAEDLMLPEVPQHKPSTSEQPLAVLLISDLHVGSKIFEAELFRKLLNWLRGQLGNRRLVEAAGRIKYLVVAGDLVDGVGVYPEQERELETPDIYRQYEQAARLMEQVPDYIQLVVIPGNHDACRRALPQPAISRKYAEPLYRRESLVSLGNPSLVKLHGASFLLHHGRSLEDVLASLPEANHEDPVKSMVALLRSRHVAPVYGQRTPIAPEPSDWLVVEEVPDFYHAGHIHIYGYTVYRGVRLVNSGCWQGQTSYQQRLGLTPTPGTAALVDLQTANVASLDFKAL